MSSSMEVLESSAMVGDTLSSSYKPIACRACRFYHYIHFAKFIRDGKYCSLMATQGLLVLRSVLSYFGMQYRFVLQPFLVSLSGKRSEARSADPFSLMLSVEVVLAFILLVAIGPVENLILKISGNDIEEAC